MFLYKEPGRNGLFGDCTLDILQEMQEKDDIDSDKENSNAETKIENTYRMII